MFSLSLTPKTPTLKFHSLDYIQASSGENLNILVEYAEIILFKNGTFFLAFTIALSLRFYRPKWPFKICRQFEGGYFSLKGSFDVAI